MRVSHVAVGKCNVTVKVLTPLEDEDGNLSFELKPRPPCDLDLTPLCAPHAFQRFMAAARCWQLSGVGLNLSFLQAPELVPMQGMEALRPPESALPVEDDDALLALVAPHPDARVAQPTAPMGHALIKELVGARAIAEHDQHVPALTLNNFRAELFHDPMLHRVLRARANEFMDVECAVAVSQLRISGHLLATSSFPFSQKKVPDAKLAKASKLELVHACLLDGWLPVAALPNSAWTCGEAKGMVGGDFRVRLHYLCLRTSSTILEKPGGLERIYHWGPNSYYDALLRLKDLSIISAMAEEDIRAMGDEGFRDLSKRRKGQELAAFDEIIDGDADVGAGAVLAASVPAIADAPGPAVVRPLLAVQAGVEPMDDRLAGRKVNFDGFSHASGNQRAFICCKFHSHCGPYNLLKDFPDERRAVAHLLAWHTLGITKWALPTQATQHTGDKPSPDECDAAYGRQFEAGP